MGWKGTIRSINAAVKSAERENQRRNKAAEKIRIASEAADAVDDWAQDINNLTSIHADLADAINWRELLNAKQPDKPSNFTKYREKLAPKLKNFKPSLFDFLIGGTQRRKSKLIAAFENAKIKDEDDQKAALAEYELAFKDWQNDVTMAKRLISGDPQAAYSVVQEMQAISDVAMIGRGVQFKFGQNFVHAIPDVHTDEIVPNYRRKQLASGKLSETKMPIGEFNELYQDYVASVALKTAGDLFHILPHSEIFVTCTTMMLDKQTGYQKPTPILSVQFVRETYMQLNLKMIDPSECLNNFNHVMNFKRTKGFVDILPIHSIDAVS